MDILQKVKAAHSNDEKLLDETEEVLLLAIVSSKFEDKRCYDGKKR